jgi:hypothetical protein
VHWSVAAEAMTSQPAMPSAVAPLTFTSSNPGEKAGALA